MHDDSTHRSSPPLRVYHAEDVTEELKSNAEKYLTRTVRYKGKGLLQLPELLEWFSADFEGPFGKQDLVSFVFLHLPKGSDIIDTLRPEYCAVDYTDRRNINSVQYQKYSWDFRYEG